MNNFNFFNQIDIKKSIMYNDSSIVVFNKPQGLATTLGHEENLCMKIFEIFPELEKIKGYKKGEGGLLNRLDNETGGLILVAKTNEAFSFYSEDMKKGKIEKFYITIVDGIISEPSGIIDYPIAHHNKNKSKMITVTNNEKYRGKPRASKTEWKLIKVTGNKSILEVKITKGARHQIRVHLASIGFPIVGDKLYNKNTTAYKYHLLYANGLKFTSFESKKNIEVFVNTPFLL